MVAIKAHLAPGFLKGPDPKLTAFLFFGTDVGLVSERCAVLAKLLAARENPPGEVLRLDENDLENDPDRLSVELQTVPMFSGRKIIRLAHSRRVNAPLLKPLIEGPPLAGVLIVEAGNLKPDDSLRALFEKTASAAAVACYADEAQDLNTLVSETLRGARKSISEEARDALVERIGADRALSRGEIQKLLTYVGDRDVIGIDDIEAIVGDGSGLAIENVPMAAASGDILLALGECDRVVASGESAQAVIAAVIRHIHRLHRIRTEFDRGRPFDDVLRGLRPQLHFKHKPAVSAQCRQWSARKLAVALEIAARSAKEARLESRLEDAHAQRLLVAIARLARTDQPPAPRAPFVR